MSGLHFLYYYTQQAALPSALICFDDAAYAVFVALPAFEVCSLKQEMVFAGLFSAAPASVLLPVCQSAAFAPVSLLSLLLAAVLWFPVCTVEWV
jgi:hypothetical protein